ncbi:hypothetical protein E2562_039423 [Oryza meyeriana var. granulata]|uniref:Uncharacterized protein n=1 Tax=Oryza meyeriana var. granulata TaxID=110450 RepID=A0A6G1CY35_9ORYZ|nr:hypothetical protein E2562_039423 [Oryza meyeriana var. granulata]
MLKDFSTSMDAITFGFAAMAILISMFLLMAIFEHLIKPHVFPPDGSLAGAVLHPARCRHGVSSGKLRSLPMWSLIHSLSLSLSLARSHVLIAMASGRSGRRRPRKQQRWTGASVRSSDGQELPATCSGCGGGSAEPKHKSGSDGRKRLVTVAGGADPPPPGTGAAATTAPASGGRPTSTPTCRLLAARDDGGGGSF